MEIEYIEVAKKEFPAILEMMADFNAIDNYPFDKKRVEKNLSGFISAGNAGKAWTIKVDKTMAGYLFLASGFSFEHNGRDAFIDELFLKPDFGRRGIGKEAPNFIENEARQLGVHVIHLEVEKHNRGGLNLYRNMGYENNSRILLSKVIFYKAKPLFDRQNS